MSDVTVAGGQKNWFVVHTYSGYEERVKKNLEQRIRFMDSGEDIAQVVIPTEVEIEVKEGQRRNVDRKILPGYVLVEMKMTDQSWNIVRNTPGVTGFVGSANKPVPLREDEVSQILKQMRRRRPRSRWASARGRALGSTAARSSISSALSTR